MSLTTDERLAIFELLARAAYAYDERDLARLAACFTPDARFSIQIVDGGPDGTLRRSRGHYGALPGRPGGADRCAPARYLQRPFLPMRAMSPRWCRI